MPTADLLDFNSLVQPIPGDNPAGAPLDYELRKKLDEARTEFNPEDYPEGAHEREQKKREANWSGIADMAKSTLARKSKHVVYVARLVESLVMMNGFAGARDGFKLFRMLFADCWDRLLPPIEEPGDEGARIAQLNWLGDPTSGAYFPTKLRKVPLFTSGGEPLSWQSWKDGVGDFEGAINAATIERCQTLLDDLAGAIEELNALQSAAEEKAPEEPPELGEVSRALNDCLALAREAMARKGGSATAEDGALVPVDGASGAGGAVSAAGVAASRESIYRQIEQLSSILEKLEPHSPVPMLLRKALTLGPMRFHQLVEVLTRDSRVIDFIRSDEES